MLLQAASFNLALILRSITKAGTPKGLAGLKIKLYCALWRALAALPPRPAPTPSPAGVFSLGELQPFAKLRSRFSEFSHRRKTGLLAWGR
jgi:hypothetical protein